MTEISGTKSLKEFDIIKFSKQVLSEIERIRSYTIATDEKTAQKFNLPTESQLNAFFRLIGLPMAVTIKNRTENNKDSGILQAGNKILTPGYDALQGRDLKNKIITNSEKINNLPIAQLLRKRENELSKIRNEIGTPNMNTRMRRALLRPLAIAPNIPATDDFSNGAINVGQVGKGNVGRPVFKKLKPLITSYIEQGVQPRAHEIARPFMRDAKRHLIDNLTILPKPFIETVIRIRLLHVSNAEKKIDKAKAQEFINKIKYTLGDDLFSETFGEDNFLKRINVLEEFVLNKMLNATSQLALKYVILERRLQSALQKDNYEISIKTSSSKQSVFGKRTSVSTNLEARKGTIANKIKELNLSISKDEALLTLLPTNDTVYIDRPNQSSTKNVLNNSLLNSFTSLLTPDLEQNRNKLKKIQEQSKKNAQELENLRVELDMMTGEFSGISIPDVVAVIVSLFLISKRDLLALLDVSALQDMKEDPSLKEALQQQEGFNDNPIATDTLNAINNLENQVDFFFAALNFWINRFRSERNSRQSKTDNKRLRVRRTTSVKSRNKALADLEE